MFLTRLCLLEDPLPDFWVVGSPLDLMFAGRRFSVPVGFRTDLASIPRLLRSLPWLDPDGCSRSGAVAHDWAYHSHELSKPEADEMLRQAIIAKGCGSATARAFWLGVKIGGGSSYSCHPDGALVTDFDTAANYARWRLENGRPLD